MYSLRLRLACPLSHGDNLVAWWLTPKQARRRATFYLQCSRYLPLKKQQTETILTLAQGLDGFGCLPTGLGNLFATASVRLPLSPIVFPCTSLAASRVFCTGPPLQLNLRVRTYLHGHSLHSNGCAKGASTLFLPSPSPFSHVISAFALA